MPLATVEEILNAVDIVELIQESVPLKRAGANYKALCPFHQEKTASFIVSPSKQIFHCFGCGKGGNAIGFLMAYEKIDFKEALTILAKKTGLRIAFKNEQSDFEKRKTELYRINKWAADLFHKTLISSEEAEFTRQYLEKRNIKKSSWAKFKIGYSGMSQNLLLKNARKDGISEKSLIELGLVFRNPDSLNLSDRFKNKLMFPIFDEMDNVRGFAGRSLDNSEPKYINSPESKIFNKGKLLYGLNFAKESVNKNKILGIVEGYTDAIFAHQMGFDWIVCCMGTFLTQDHVRLIRRYANEVVLIYDGDTGGQKAVERSLDLFLNEEVNLSVAFMPEGMDPYDCLFKLGSNKFQQKINERVSLLDCKIEIEKNRNDVSKPDGSYNAIDSILKTLVLLEDPLKLHLYIKKLADEFSIDERKINERYSIIKKKSREFGRHTYSDFIEQNSDRSFKAGCELIEILLTNNKYIDEIDTFFKKNCVSEEFLEDVFNNEKIKKIIKIIFETYRLDKEVTFSKVLISLDDEGMQSFLVNIMEEGEKKQNLVDVEKRFSQLLRYLENEFKSKANAQLHNELKKIHSSNDELENEILQKMKKNKVARFNINRKA